MSEMNYPPKEKDLQSKIKALMDEWKAHCDAKSEWQGKFVSDGFFPYYTKQAVRVLFIGRESYGKSGGDYIASYNEMSTPNFHNRLLYLAYGIVKSESSLDDWLSMDDAKKLDARFAESGGFSYAFMNASKINNATGWTMLCKELFYAFIDDPKNRENIIREIELLDPDIIVSANLGDLGFFDRFPAIERSADQPCEDCCVWYLNSGKKIPWIDGWHFSARKPTFESFYSPICSLAKDLLTEKQP